VILLVFPKTDRSSRRMIDRRQSKCWHVPMSVQPESRAAVDLRHELSDGDTISMAERTDTQSQCAARCRQSRSDPRTRRAREQPQGRQHCDPEAPANGVHRSLRLGQELSGVRAVRATEQTGDSHPDTARHWHPYHPSTADLLFSSRRACLR
jgi:hypothetical protein